jgi:transposase
LVACGRRRFVRPRGLGERGDARGPNPTDRGKPGGNRHLLTDGHGTPMVIQFTVANVDDGSMSLPLVGAMPRVRGQVGAPRRKPISATADKAYYSKARELGLRQRDIIPFLDRRGRRDGMDDDTLLGADRWVVERTLAWLNQFRRLRVRHECRSDIQQAFLSLGCAVVRFRTLNPLLCERF